MKTASAGSQIQNTTKAKARRRIQKMRQMETKRGIQKTQDENGRTDGEWLREQTKTDSTKSSMTCQDVI